MFISRRLLIALAPLALSAGLAACSGGGSEGATRSSVERDDDMALGNPNAPVVVVEYASLTCPHCADFHKEIFPEFKKKFIDTGKVRFVFRQFPTPPVPYAVGAEAVARCAGPDKYFDLLDILYEKQSYWIRSSNPRKALMDIAATAGVSQDQFDACVSDQENIKRIQEVSKVAQEKFNITGTPSFVINGKLEPQVRTIESFEEIINPILGIKPEPKKEEKTEPEAAATSKVEPKEDAQTQTDTGENGEE